MRVSQEVLPMQVLQPQGGRRREDPRAGRSASAGSKAQSRDLTGRRTGATSFKSNSRHRVDMPERKAQWTGQVLQALHSPPKAPGPAGF